MSEDAPNERSSNGQPAIDQPSNDQPSNEQRDQRLRNRQALVTRGLEPYPYSYEVSDSAAELHERYAGLEAGAVVEGSEAAVAGRLVLLRMLGKLTFATLQDASGRIQVSFQKDDLDEYNALKKFDLGDWVAVEGSLYATKTGELTVRAGSFALL